MPPEEPAPKRPSRSPDEIERDIEAERAGLVDAVTSLRTEVGAFRQRVARTVPRVALAAGAAIVSLMVLRRILRSRR